MGARGDVSDPCLTTDAEARGRGRASRRAYQRALDRCEWTLRNKLVLELESRRVHRAERDGKAIRRAIAAGVPEIGEANRATTCHRPSPAPCGK